MPGKDQQNIVVDNLFNEEQIQWLKRFIDSKEIDVVDPHNGRYLKGLDNQIREDIMDIVVKLARETSGEDLVPGDIGYSYYNNQYGEVCLPPHIDANRTEFVIDYQLDANVEWPIVIEKKEFVLKNNQAIVFAGGDQIHWRPRQKFTDDQYTAMIFFHMITKDHWTLTNGVDPRTTEEWQKKSKSAFGVYERDYMDN